MTLWRQRFLLKYENNNTYKQNNNLNCIKRVSDSIKKNSDWIKNWKGMTGKIPLKVLCRFNEVTIIYGHFCGRVFCKLYENGSGKKSQNILDEDNKETDWLKLLRTHRKKEHYSFDFSLFPNMVCFLKLISSACKGLSLGNYSYI